MNLTDEQLRIVSHPAGHARVSAVAGSGKTTTMVARVGHLLEQGNGAGNILILMFNKSARDAFAESMKNRLAARGPRLPEVRTFHSLGMRLVASFTRRGVLPSYTLVTEEYLLEKLARQAAGEIYREEADGEGWLAGDEVEEFLTFIERVKSTAEGAAQVFGKSGLTSRYSYFVRAYELFETVRQKQRIRFYPDLIHEPLLAMLDNDRLRAWVSNRVDHIIVDEYQDINESQQQLLKILAGDRADVMVVGDADQCIYEWRGARPEYITSRFQLDFPKPENYLLSYTFRYGHQLSLAANHLIATNNNRDKKFCISYETTPATQLFCLEEKSAVHPVLQVLQEWRSQDRSLLEAAVLVRLFAQSVPVELALLEAGIPYRLEGNASVFDCPEVRALTGYLQLAEGRLVDNEPQTLNHVLTAMLSQPHLGIRREEMTVLVQALAANPPGSSEKLWQWAKKEMPSFVAKRFEEAAETWRWLTAGTFSCPADKLLKDIIEKVKLFDFYHNFAATSASAENRIKTCQAFIDFAAAENLSAGGLLDKICELRLSGQKGKGETLLITSVHRAKGLEWPLVILPGLDEGSFPFCRDRPGTADKLEDERRLFYVAMTRAREKLVCIHPKDALLERSISTYSREHRGDMVRASRFLYEMNSGLSVSLGTAISEGGDAQPVSTDDAAIAARYLKKIGKKTRLVRERTGRGIEKKRSPGNLKIDDIAEGMEVFHQVFGSGTVSAVKDRRQGRLTVFFEGHGEMVLLARYAKLQAV